MSLDCHRHRKLDELQQIVALKITTLINTGNVTEQFSQSDHYIFPCPYNRPQIWPLASHTVTWRHPTCVLCASSVTGLTNMADIASGHEWLSSISCHCFSSTFCIVSLPQPHWPFHHSFPAVFCLFIQSKERFREEVNTLALWLGPFLQCGLYNWKALMHYFKTPVGKSPMCGLWLGMGLFHFLLHAPIAQQAYRLWIVQVLRQSYYIERTGTFLVYKKFEEIWISRPQQSSVTCVTQ